MPETTTTTRTSAPERTRKQPFIDPDEIRAPDTICPQQRREQAWDF